MSSDPSSLSNKPICQFFKKRQCYKGRACPFLHIIDIKSEAETNQNDSSVRSNIPPRFQRSSDNSHYSGVHQNRQYDTQELNNKRVCEHYLRGHCSFGDRCRYFHPTKYDNSKIVNSCETEIEQIDNLKVSTTENDQRSVNTDQKGNQKLCRYFQKGHCRDGKRCRFLHVRRNYEQKPRDSWKRDMKGSSKKKSEPEETNENEVKSSDQVTRSRVVTGGRGHPQVPARQTPAFSSALEARQKEIELIQKRCPGAEVTEKGSEGTAVKFTFTPSDPDWPYDVKVVTFEIILPSEYPCKMMKVDIAEADVIPDYVRSLISEAVMDWVEQRFAQQKKELNESQIEYDLAVRPMLRWFDKNAEDIFTDSLKQYKRKKLAEAAGLQFIPATQLRKVYKGAVESNNEKLLNGDVDKQGAVAEANTESNGEEDYDSNVEGEGLSTEGEGDSEESGEEETDSESEGEELQDERRDMPEVVEVKRRGTEVTLQGLKISEGVAWLRMSVVTVTVSCGRCNHVCDITTPCGRVNAAVCAFCRTRMLVRMNATLVHERARGVAGYMDLEQCSAADLNLSRSSFVAGCLKCDQEAKIESLAPGQPNVSWCTNCHQKLCLTVSSVRFLRLSVPSAVLDDEGTGTCIVEVQKRIKAVKDPLIQEGKPLPSCGTCKHYKKSYRWLRFPCCGKAYPCDICHDENENHEMKRANRMICGYCAKEQAYSAEAACAGCKASMTYKTTAHWEGGLGCRDKIKMARNDKRKFSNNMKTISKSVEERRDESKKNTKLRHVV